VVGGNWYRCYRWRGAVIGGVLLWWVGTGTVVTVGVGLLSGVTVVIGVGVSVGVGVGVGVTPLYGL